MTMTMMCITHASHLVLTNQVHITYHPRLLSSKKAEGELAPGPAALVGGRAAESPGCQARVLFCTLLTCVTAGGKRVLWSPIELWGSFGLCHFLFLLFPDLRGLLLWLLHG